MSFNVFFRTCSTSFLPEGEVRRGVDFINILSSNFYHSQQIQLVLYLILFYSLALFRITLSPTPLPWRGEYFEMPHTFNHKYSQTSFLPEGEARRGVEQNKKYVEELNTQCSTSPFPLLKERAITSSPKVSQSKIQIRYSDRSKKSKT